MGRKIQDLLYSIQNSTMLVSILFDLRFAFPSVAGRLLPQERGKVENQSQP